MSNAVNSSWPCFSQEEADAVREVLLSNKVNYWTGTQGRLFEEEFAAFSKVKYAVALANGTVALDLALVALGIGSGDEVVVTSRTFIASVSSIITAGATPIFADVDKDSQNITRESVLSALSSKTKAIIAVHLAGWPCEMDEIMAIADQHGIYVIEDCAQAHGAEYKGKPVGGIGHIAAWSFCQDKIVTTGGEGGMLTTNDKALWSKAWSYKDHGKSWDAVYKHEHPPGFRWLHESFGTNWRMTEMQACIGRIQLKKLLEWRGQRAANANRIMRECKNLDWFRVPDIPDYITHAFYKCYVFVDIDSLPTGWTRDRVIQELQSLGVACMQGTCSEVYLEKAFENTGWRPTRRLENAEELGKSSIMFLVHPTLQEEEIDRVCSGIQKVGALIDNDKG